MGTIGNPRDYLILTNNPLVPACMEGKGLYTIDFRPELSYREILTLVRDKVYLVHEHIGRFYSLVEPLPFRLEKSEGCVGKPCPYGMGVRAAFQLIHVVAQALVLPYLVMGVHLAVGHVQDGLGPVGGQPE